MNPDAAAELRLLRAEITALRRRVKPPDQDPILNEINGLRGEIRRLKLVALQPRHGFMSLFIKDLETNPHAQFTVHKWGMWYWVINFPLVTMLFFLEPSVWLKWGLYITLIYSIYANFATDYGAMSAAMAAYEDRPGLPPIPVSPVNGVMKDPNET
jgi:hypothetical protein